MSFVNLRDAGDPAELAELYDREGADELIFLDIDVGVNFSVSVLCKAMGDLFTGDIGPV